jgi:hypothetical protein
MCFALHNIMCTQTLAFLLPALTLALRRAEAIATSKGGEVPVQVCVCVCVRLFVCLCVYVCWALVSVGS